jgi:hypothetical protein
MIKKVTLAAIAAALPLTALAATPASANASGGHDDKKYDLSVDVKKKGDDKVKVTASCEEDDKKDHNKGGEHQDKAKAKLEVSFRDWSEKYWIDCDGDEFKRTFWVKSRKGGKFEAVLKKDRDKEVDSVWLKGKHDH